MKNFTLFWLSCLLTGQLYAQKTLSLAELKQAMDTQDDTLRVINLWATWCKPCVEELPYFIAVGKELQAKGEKVKFLLVAVEDKPATVQAFLQKKGYDQIMNPNPLFCVLTEKDANVWIPQIDAKWEGEIPATLLINAKQAIRAFYPKQMTRTELENIISSHQKKN